MSCVYFFLVSGLIKLTSDPSNYNIIFPNNHTMTNSQSTFPDFKVNSSHSVSLPKYFVHLRANPGPKKQDNSQEIAHLLDALHIQEAPSVGDNSDLSSVFDPEFDEPFRWNFYHRLGKENAELLATIAYRAFETLLAKMPELANSTCILSEV
jgi:hypothetical protein